MKIGHGMAIPTKMGLGPIKVGLARPVADYHSAWRIRHPGAVSFPEGASPLREDYLYQIQ